MKSEAATDQTLKKEFLDTRDHNANLRNALSTMNGSTKRVKRALQIS